MIPPDAVVRLLSDFILLDRRLEEHPGVAVRLFARDNSRTTFIAANRVEVSKEKLHLPAAGAIAAEWTKYHQKPSTSGLFRIWIGSDLLGYMEIRCRTPQMRERAQGAGGLLGTAISAAYGYNNGGSLGADFARRLGMALRCARNELKLTVEGVSRVGGFQSRALLQWENGIAPNNVAMMFRWLKALGLLADENNTIVTSIDVTNRFLEIIRNDPAALRNLSPEQFERFVAERIEKMGFDVTLTGSTNHKDGGIDLIAVPQKRTVASFLLAGQIKHHRGLQKTGRDAVDRLLAWKSNPFHLGLLVTNSGFTADAKWVAEQTQNRSFLRLRDLDALRNWVAGIFTTEEDWREIPEEIKLAPGVVVRVPRPRVSDSI